MKNLFIKFKMLSLLMCSVLFLIGGEQNIFAATPSDWPNFNWPAGMVYKYVTTGGWQGTHWKRAFDLDDSEIPSGEFAVICHGMHNALYHSSSDWVENIAQALNGQGVAVFAIDWGNLSFDGKLLGSASTPGHHIPKVAKRASYILFTTPTTDDVWEDTYNYSSVPPKLVDTVDKRMFKLVGKSGKTLNPNNAHFIGHSHGSHVLGNIANMRRVKRLTLLDCSPRLGGHTWIPIVTPDSCKWISDAKNCADLVEFYKSSQLMSWDAPIGHINLLVGKDRTSPRTWDLENFNAEDHGFSHKWYLETIKNPKAGLKFQLGYPLGKTLGRELISELNTTKSTVNWKSEDFENQFIGVVQCNGAANYQLDVLERWFTDDKYKQWRKDYTNHLNYQGIYYHADDVVTRHSQMVDIYLKSGSFSETKYEKGKTINFDITAEDYLQSSKLFGENALTSIKEEVEIAFYLDTIKDKYKNEKSAAGFPIKISSEKMELLSDISKGIMPKSSKNFKISIPEKYDKTITEYFNKNTDGHLYIRAEVKGIRYLNLGLIEIPIDVYEPNGQEAIEIIPPNRFAVLCIDNSGSMATNDKNGQRKSSAKRFLDLLAPATDKAALVHFEGSVTSSTGFETPKTLKSKIQIQNGGGTDIAGAINQGISLLQSAVKTIQNNAAICVLTDGENNDGDRPVLNAISRAKDLGIRVHYMHFGSQVFSASSLEPQAEAAADNNPSDIARAILSTGGVYGDIVGANNIKSFVDTIFNSGLTSDGDSDENVIPGQVTMYEFLDEDQETAEYWFSGQEDEEIKITVTGIDYSPEVILLDQNENQLARSSAGSNMIAEITKKLPYTGQYKVVIQASDGGHGLFTIFVDVENLIEEIIAPDAPPVIGKQPQSLTVNEGDSATFTVEIQSWPYKPLDMVWCPAGTFQMGSGTNSNYNYNPSHQVTLSKGFWIGRYEVTQGQYEAIMGFNPAEPHIPGPEIADPDIVSGPDFAVNWISWDAAVEFCEKLTKLEKAAGRLPKGYEYRLPTDAQWEYACRAGTTTQLNSGKSVTATYSCPNVDEVAWYYYNWGTQFKKLEHRVSNKVGEKLPNAWGIYDMHGNVGEWCSDRYGKLEADAVTDPTGVTYNANSQRVVRGGNYASNASQCTSMAREGVNSSYDSVNNEGKWSTYGFRVALVSVDTDSNVSGEDFTVPMPVKQYAYYQWYKDGTAISGATEKTYTIDDVTSYDSGNYKVVVSNSIGSVTSETAVLTVKISEEKLRIITQPKSQTVAEGDSVTFSVVASGITPLSYQWYKDNVKISGATSSSYTISSVTVSDAGSYMVTVSNSVGFLNSDIAKLLVGKDFSIESLKYTILTQNANTGTVSVKALNEDVKGSITIPSSVKWDGITYRVTEIEDYAFNNCNSLTGITIPDSVFSIGEGAFYNCSRLTSITIPDSVTSIGHSFYGCDQLPPILFSTGKKILVRYSFSNTATSYVIPNTVTYIAGGAFWNCNSLTSITIPDSVISIGDRAFQYCGSLTSITIGNGVTSIGDDAFTGCSRLTSITIGNGVTSIGSGAFSGCSSLTGITISDSVTSIGSYAFFDCSSLTSITISDSVTSIGDSAFRGCDQLPPILFSTGKKVLVRYSPSNTKTSYTIPDTVTYIAGGAFWYCNSLTSIVIPDGVTSIGDGAFRDCSKLTSITIPDNVTSIGDGAFEYCGSLTSIVIPDGVTSIGDGAFRDCSKLTSITIPDSVISIGDKAFEDCSKLTSIVIPDGVTSIGNWAFQGCGSLTSIVIPDGVTSIGNWAFQYCGSLTSVYYRGNVPVCSPGLYQKTPSNLISYYPEGNTTWEAAIVDGKWQDRGVANWNPSFSSNIPVITDQPVNQTVNEGDSVTFSVTASGTDLGYQWYKDGSPISGATNSNYMINGVKTSDAGSYTVTVSNSAGSVDSSVATLTVNSLATLSSIQINGSGSVEVGSTATYICTATYSNGATKTVSPTWSISSGANCVSITSDGILTANTAGTAKIKAVYSENEITRSAEMSVLVNNVVVQPDGFTYQWYKNGQPISGATSASYSINGITEADFAEYSVAVSNENGETRSYPVYLIHDKESELPPAQPLTYQWYKNGQPISGATSASYSINGITEADFAEYSVVVSNENGETRSYPVYLIHDKESELPPAQPLTYQWYKNGGAINGATGPSYSINSITREDFAEYTVEVSNENGVTTSYPAYLTNEEGSGMPLFYQWYKDGKAISGATRTSYTIPSVELSDAGSYHVVVSNDFGSVTSDDATLTVSDDVVKPAITTQPKSQTVDENSPVTFNVAATGTGLTYQWYKDGKAIGGANGTSYTISSAKSSDAGSYTVMVSNSAGSVTSSAAVLTVNSGSSTDGTAVRSISINGLTATVTLKLTPSDDVNVYFVEETVPAVGTITPNNGGVYVSTKNVIRWSFLDGMAREISYTVTVPSDFSEKVTVSGEVTFDTTVKTIEGDTVLDFAAKTHPADTNDDFEITTPEVSLYAVAWKLGRDWSREPVDIPMNYVARGALIWINGGDYIYDSSKAKPSCWVNATAKAASVELTSASTNERKISVADGKADVSIEIVPAEDISIYLVEEKLPEDVTLNVSNISDGGNYVAAKNVIRWSFLDGEVRTLTYTVEPEPGFEGTLNLSGEVMFDEETFTTEGDTEANFGAEPVKPDISFAVEGDGMTLVLDFVGTLYESDDAVNWRVVEGAKAPFTVDTSKGKKFYRCAQ